MAEKKPMKDNQDIADELADLYADLRKGHVRAADVKELANIAGKLLNKSKQDMEYTYHKKKHPGTTIAALEHRGRKDETKPK